MPRQYTTQERVAAFWDKVQFTDTCWLWTGGIDRYGYGKFRFNGRMAGAHVYAYEFCVGPIPEGLQIDHLCRTRPCQNTDHMELVTSRVNTLRGEGITAKKARQTHCINGHLFDEANTGHYGTKRVCRACDRETQRVVRSLN